MSTWEMIALVLIGAVLYWGGVWLADIRRERRSRRR